MVNQPARSFRPDFFGPSAPPALPARHGPHIHPNREPRKAPTSPPKSPLRTSDVSYLLAGCVRPTDDKPGTLTLLSNGMVQFSSQAGPNFEFPLLNIKRWVKERSRFGHDCKAEFAYKGNSVYLNIGDVLAFCQSCT